MAGLRTADRETSPIRNSAKNEKRVASTPPRRLLRHVEQAVAAAVASPMRKVRRTRRDGTAATKLLGDEHGSMWDLMDWVNVVLGKNEITKATKSPHRKLSRVESLNVGDLCRLTDHVLQKLRALERWTCHCERTNLPQAPRCESCFDTRDKGERPYHGHAASPTHQDSGARGGDTFTGTRPNGEKILPVGEIEIWTKLAELRDFSTDNLLAAFPEGLSEIQGRGKRARK